MRVLLRSARNLPANAELAAALERAAQAVADNAADRDGVRALEIGLALCAQDAVTSQVLRQLLDSLRENAAEANGQGDLTTTRNKVVLHRDWTGARHAMLRATGLMLLVGAAWIATGWPADARRRRIHLTEMMLDEVSSMAAEERSSDRHAVWQARLYHRLLKLIQSASRSGEPLPPVTSGVLAVLAVGNAIQSLQQVRRAQPGTPTARRADLALQRLTRLRQQPAAGAGTLRRLADHLQRQDHGAAWSVDNAARSIDANLEFFRSGALSI